MKPFALHHSSGLPGEDHYRLVPVFKKLVPALVLVAQLAVPFCARPAATVPATNSPNSLDESAFKILSDRERNIFNTRRSARYVPSASRTRVSRSENLALVGTLTYDKGPRAFFDGSRSEYRKVLRPEDTIAEFKILAVEPSFVKLASATNEFELHVGMQLKREDQGEWQLSERPENLEPVVNRSSYSRSSQTRPEPSTSSDSGGEAPFPEAAPGQGGDIPPTVMMIDPQTGLPVPTAGPVVVPLPAQEGGATAQPQSSGSGPVDTLELLRRRRAAENQ